MDQTTPAQPGIAVGRVACGYLIYAHIALTAAALVVLWDPSHVAGFFYHPRMVAVVHALTLGWISSGLIGLLYLRGPVRGGRLDGWVLAAWILGSSGVVSHFWIAEFNGLYWSAGLLTVAATLLAARFCAAVARAELPASAALAVQLAFVNLIATALIGVLLGINKTTTILPGYSLHNVFAHAHLAGLGWAFLLALALCTLQQQPAAPTRRGIWVDYVAIAAIQLGATGLFVSLLTGRPFALGFGLLAVVGVTLGAAGFLARARRALSTSIFLAYLVAIAWFAIAAWLGLRLAFAAQRAEAPDAILLYGVAGLLGGLGGWVFATLLREFERSPNATIAFAGWAAGPTAIALGLVSGSLPTLRLGAALVLTAIGVALHSVLRPRATAVNR